MSRVAWSPRSLALIGVTLAACSASPATDAAGDWQRTFDVPRDELVPTGRSAYLILEPGYQLVLQGEGDELIVTVLDQTRRVDGVETRVVEERESEKGELVEVSRNFLALHPATGDVYYFGEEVDLYEDGQVVRHEGAWLAGEDGARFGLLMPGTPRVGQRYYQEVAPGRAMDRAEVMSLAGSIDTPVGTFHDALVTEETTPLERGERERKLYAPGIGLLREEHLLLTRHGPVRR